MIKRINKNKQNFLSVTPPKIIQEGQKVLTGHYHKKYLLDQEVNQFVPGTLLLLVLLSETQLRHQHHHILVLKPGMRTTKIR